MYIRFSIIESIFYLSQPLNMPKDEGREGISPTLCVELPHITEEQRIKVDKAKRFIEEYNKNHYGGSSSSHTIISHMTALQSMQQAAHMVILCRIYIGSINFELNEHDIRAVFEAFGTIRQLNMSLEPATNKHKGYCFVEYETAEAASLALMTMDGRPNNYPATLASSGLTNAPQERIYVSNVHTAIGEEDLWTIFKVFGEIRAVVLLPNILTGRHKGYGYIEFEQEMSATMAVTAMNQFLLGGLQLRVGRAVVGGPLPAGMTGTVFKPKKVEEALEIDLKTTAATQEATSIEVSGR
jgi:poly(U)-binding-splicing factor PUF60